MHHTSQRPVVDLDAAARAMAKSLRADLFAVGLSFESLVWKATVLDGRFCLLSAPVDNRIAATAGLYYARRLRDAVAGRLGIALAPRTANKQAS